MKNKLASLIFFFCLNVNVFANEAESGAHHEPSIWDLKYPTLNFVLLVGFLVWKLKKPLADMFDKKASDVKTLMESAEKQSKDANAKLAGFEDKIKNIDSELVKISDEYENDVVTFGKNQSLETETVAARMKRDIENKLAGERKELTDCLSHEILEKVVAKTQNSIGTNSELKKKATINLIMGIK